MKIVVCGPPHSGKSVFVEQLRRRLLPLGIVGVLEGCPDGEGGWAGATDQASVGALRRKGKFTQEFVSWVIKSVEGSPMPLLLVDVGGVRSAENERIFSACDAFIVLANPAKVGELEAWDVFGRAHGCKPVALLASVLNGESVLALNQGDGVVRGTQAGLERGHRVGGPVLDALVAQLVAAVGKKALPGELEATIHTGRLADALGIPAETRDARLGFRPEHGPTIRAFSQEACGEPEVRLWGALPAWVAALIACDASGVAKLWDIRLGWVNLPELVLAPEPSAHLAWRVEQDNGHTLVSFAIPGGVFDPTKLVEVVLPVVLAGASVVLSGRGPHWLVAAVARAYAKAGHPVAVAALHETSARQSGGQTWGEANPGFAPAVVITGENPGRLVTVPVALIK